MPVLAVVVVEARTFKACAHGYTIQ